MPFRSTAQQGWAFATGQPFARRWADETDFARLPRRARSRRKRWGQRRKAAAVVAVKAPLSPEERSRIARLGGLARWGKYQPQRGPARGLAQRLAKPQQPAKGRTPKKGGGGRQSDPEKRRQQQEDRAARQQRQQQRDAERQQDRTARQQRQEQRDMERKVDRALRDAERQRREQERQQRGGGGGGGKKGPDPAQQQRQAQQDARQRQRDAERQQDRAARQQRQTQQDAARAARQAQADERQQQRNQAQQQRQVDAERRRTEAAAARQAQQQQRDAERQRRAAEAAQREIERSRVTTPELADAARQLSTGQALDPAAQDALVRNGLARRDRDGALALTSTGLRATRQKAGGFFVFKDAAGRMRWVTRTTTAFRDRDGEILSTDALERASARMAQKGVYGPLRLWHIAADPSAPWGPGLDIGDCDASMLIGRTLIESGTFRDERIGQKIAQRATDWEVSPGFLYLPEWRDASGVFRDIEIFERSLVPVPEGRASNLYTGLSVQIKESPMDMSVEEVKRRLKALEQRLGMPLAGVEAERQRGEKSADAAQVAFKGTGASMPDAVGAIAVPDDVGNVYLIKDGAVVSVFKAAPGMGGMAGMDGGSMEDAPETEVDLDMGGDEPLVGDMSMSELRNEITAAVRAALPDLAQLETQLNSMGYERRQKEQQQITAVQQQVARLSAQLKAAQTQVAQVTSLETKLKEAQQQLAELRGEQPPAAGQSGYRASGDPATRLDPQTPAVGAKGATNNPIDSFIDSLPTFAAGQNGAAQ